MTKFSTEEVVRLFLTHQFQFIPIHSSTYNPDLETYQCSCYRKTNCNAKGKHPILKNWQYTPIPPNDEKTLNIILTAPFAFAIATGARNNDADANQLIVIDVDLPGLNDPIISSLPPTLTIATQSGGLHFYYFIPNSQTIHNLSTGYIDVRSNGGYVVAPPTPNYRPLNNLPIAYIPQLPNLSSNDPSHPTRQYQFTSKQQMITLTPENKIKQGSRDYYVFSELRTLTEAGLTLSQLLTHTPSIHSQLEQPPKDPYTLTQVNDKAYYVHKRFSDPQIIQLRQTLDTTIFSKAPTSPSKSVSIKKGSNPHEDT